MTTSTKRPDGGELKTCPFCGGPAHTTKSIASAKLAALVMCTDNDCATMSGETLLEAVARWNTRAPTNESPAPQAGEASAVNRTDRIVHWLKRYQADEHLSDDDCEELDALINTLSREALIPTRTPAPAPQPPVEGLREALSADALNALKSYQQADADGVMVLVSRQALEEAINALNTELGQSEDDPTCPACIGSGITSAVTSDDDVCKRCHGSGIDTHFIQRETIRRDSEFAALAFPSLTAGENTKSDGGSAEGQPSEIVTDQRSSADAMASSGDNVAAGVLPGPSDPSSTAPAPDVREAVAQLRALLRGIRSRIGMHDPNWWDVAAEILNEEISHLTALSQQPVAVADREAIAGEFEPVGTQYLHYSPFTGHEVWLDRDFYNGHRATVSREVFARKSVPALLHPQPAKGERP